jgi:SAM-dependent methyltransferase
MSVVKRRLKQKAQTVRARRLCRAVESIIGDTVAPQTYRAEADFELLQNRYNGVPEYGYDPVTLWCRGMERVIRLQRQLPELAGPRRVLEVGCGDGMVGFALSTFGHEAVLTDLEDWRDKRAAHLRFVKTDASAGLPLPDNSFDFACSYNTFEHLPDPLAAVRDIARVIKPGGLIHLDFNPLYASPWGMHAYRMLRMPYPQFLFSEPFVEAALKRMVIHDLGQERTELQPMNRWRLEQFRAAWREAGLIVVHENLYRADDHLQLVADYPEAFGGRGLTLDDLTVAGMEVTLRVPPRHGEARP